MVWDKGIDFLECNDSRRCLGVRGTASSERLHGSERTPGVVCTPSPLQGAKSQIAWRFDRQAELPSTELPGYVKWKPAQAGWPR